MARLRQFSPGEIILRENECGDTAYVIERGRVEVSKQLHAESVHLAFLGPGETFGEMSVIDDKPRSATVRAVEETLVREIRREGFFQGLQSDREAGVNLLKVLFERLREAEAQILELTRACGRGKAGAASSVRAPPGEADTILLLDGRTPEAADALPVNPMQIKRFPFRIGRLCHNVLAYNDLKIPESPPAQISEHHVTLFVRDGRVGVLDRGSALGALVDGKQVGGPKGEAGPLFFEGPEGTLVLGAEDSPYRYRVVVTHRT
jgi:CRP/FNR family transcriptional regulator, cyclic AMP receptor protein